MKFIDLHDHEAWHPAGGEDGPPVNITPSANLLLSLEQWHAIRAQWPAGLPVGVSLPNSADVEDALGPEPGPVTMVALHFPKWTDGRAYSQARLLRQRLRFGGEIRATGEVLVDMLPLLKRTGFDAAVLRSDQKREVAEKVLGFFAEGHYQGDVQEGRPWFLRTGGAA